MRTSDFAYDLPAHLIAQHPLAERNASRLLVVDAGADTLIDRQFVDLPAYLQAGDVLVFNDTRVLPARLFARKASGGRVEILLERLMSEHQALCQLRASKGLRIGGVAHLDAGVTLTCVGREGAFFVLDCSQPMIDVLMQQGHMPLPPYIERAAETADQDRYQTVYAKQPGAVAAPTAGLHFDAEMLQRLSAQGVILAYVTLHVGAGTYQPVRVEQLSEHRMHAEWLEVPEATVAACQTARAAGRRVIAVGTTAVRSLETASADGVLKPYRGDTRMFIYPGYTFQTVDGLVTNFHLPESTLLMLVSALGGYERMMRAYRHAVAAEYRFFSYGDAMLILPRGQ